MKVGHRAASRCGDGELRTNPPTPPNGCNAARKVPIGKSAARAAIPRRSQQKPSELPRARRCFDSRIVASSSPYFSQLPWVAPRSGEPLICATGRGVGDVNSARRRRLGGTDQRSGCRGVWGQMAFLGGWSHSVYIPDIPGYTEQVELISGLKMFVCARSSI
jgi:hypothetical protein